MSTYNPEQAMEKGEHYHRGCHKYVPNAFNGCRGLHIFFKRTYQTKPGLVPTGLMMTYGRWVVTSSLRNIINPAGHFASDAE